MLQDLNRPCCIENRQLSARIQSAHVFMVFSAASPNTQARRADKNPCELGVQTKFTVPHNKQPRTPHRTFPLAPTIGPAATNEKPDSIGHQFDLQPFGNTDR